MFQSVKSKHQRDSAHETIHPKEVRFVQIHQKVGATCYLLPATCYLDCFAFADSVLSDDKIEPVIARVIEIDADPALHFDGESTQSIEVIASLIDGFVYRMPFEFSVKDGVKLSDLNGQTVCQCASLQLDKGSVGESSNNVRGSILLRPNKVPLEQTLRLYGTLPGEVEATELGRVKVACKVFAPLRLQPAWIGVSESNPFPETIKLQLSHGVEIQEADMQDGHSFIGGKYDKEDSLFRLELPKGDTPDGSAWLNRDGNLLFRFKIEYQKMQSEYEVVVPYGPPRPTRVAPEDVIFRQDRDMKVYVGRLFILGLQSEVRPELVMEYRVDWAAWVRSDSEFVIDSFTRGRASGHITIPKDKVFLSRESKTRLRLIDTGTEKSIAEFNGSLLE